MSNLIFYSIPIFILGMILELFLVQRKKLNFYRFNDTINNLSNGLFQQTLGFIPTLIGLFFYSYFSKLHLFDFSGQSLLNYIFCWIVVDFAYYWAHRFFHRNSFAWSGHVVHHQSEEYNLSVALRQSWLQGFHSIPFVLLPALFNFDLSVYVTCQAINTLYQFWIHTRLINKMPYWFELVFNTPSHHRVHHGRNIKYLDKNYAGSLIIWDKMFKTFQQEEEEVFYGVTSPTKKFDIFNDQFKILINWFKYINNISFKEKIIYSIKSPGYDVFLKKEKIVYETRQKFDPKISFNLKCFSAGFFLLSLILFAFISVVKVVTIYKIIIIIMSIILALYLANKLLNEPKIFKS